jgi:hypothetical protein
MTFLSVRDMTTPRGRARNTRYRKPGEDARPFDQNSACVDRFRSLGKCYGVIYPSRFGTDGLQFHPATNANGASRHLHWDLRKQQAMLNVTLNKKTPAVLALLLLVLTSPTITACTTVQAQSTATAELKNVSLDHALKISTHAALDAGFTIASESWSAPSGLISATRNGNRLLTWANPVIQIYISENMGASTLQISSTVQGQLFDYGTTSDVITDFCNSLARIDPPTHWPELTNGPFL